MKSLLLKDLYNISHNAKSRLVVLIFLAIAMGINYDVHIVYFSYPVGWFFSALFVYLYYRLFVRHNYAHLK